MRKVLFLLLLLIPTTAFCTNKQKLKSMPVSRWREVKRMGLDSTIIPFSDTLFISFLRKDSFSYHYLNGFIYNGPYTISDDSLLDFGTARFRIVAKKPTSFTLSDAKGIYVFGVDLSDTAKIIVLDTNTKVLPVDNIDLMIGHWTVYKKVPKEEGKTIDNTIVIRSLYITGPSTDGKLGYIIGGKDPINVPGWYIKNYNSDQSLDCDGNNPRSIKVVKCQGGEMILEEAGISYYLKQFK